MPYLLTHTLQVAQEIQSRKVDDGNRNIRWYAIANEAERDYAQRFNSRNIYDLLAQFCCYVLLKLLNIKDLKTKHIQIANSQ